MPHLFAWVSKLTLLAWLSVTQPHATTSIYAVFHQGGWLRRVR